MAGWDDEDDDWERRDHGPRPHVPDHGRRPLLMALPIFLITAAAVVAILLAGCGDDEPSSTSQGTTPAATTSTSGSPEAIATKLAEGAALISGRADPDDFADVSCETTETTGEFRCSYGNEGDPDSGTITVRVQPDGTLGKVLGGKAPQGTSLTSDEVTVLLAADDESTGTPGTTYACATATAVNPDGSSAQNGQTGFRCVTTKGKQIQRYVQFAPDSTAIRDFEVTQ